MQVCNVLRSREECFWAMITKSCHDAKFIVTPGTVGRLKDNTRSHQWRQGRHHDKTPFSAKKYYFTSWWRNQMETFSASLALCAGNSPVPVNSPHRGQWRGALMFSLICVWLNGWVNNREAGDLRRHRGHYDVIVMRLQSVKHINITGE